MAENGRLVLPASLRTEVGLPAGGDFLALVENGVIILEPRKKALERIRNLVRLYAPAEEGVSVVDELIAERHAAASRANGDDFPAKHSPARAP
jgi:bifunctional DNA-binding transcriptional regulator/antitoxin component of YhaV-PrlF toxin-antitoxin module